MHCRTKEEAERLREAITRRLAECGLEVNLQKTKIVYCKDGDRKGSHGRRSLASSATSSGPGGQRTAMGNTL